MKAKQMIIFLTMAILFFFVSFFACMTMGEYEDDPDQWPYTGDEYETDDDDDDGDNYDDDDYLDDDSADDDDSDPNNVGKTIKK